MLKYSLFLISASAYSYVVASLMGEREGLFWSVEKMGLWFRKWR